MKKLNLKSAVAALLAISALSEAQATTFTVGSYDPLFQGIDETTATIQGGSGVSQAYVVRINLNAPGVGFNTTPHSGTLETTSQTTSQYLASSGSQVAINAAFFDPCGCSTTTSDAKNLEGLAISNGALVSPDQAGNASLLLTQDNHASFAAGGAANISNIWTAVSGGGFVLQNGVDVVTGSLPGDPLNPNPRSVVGLSQDDMYMYLVAIDGRQAGYSNGVTQAEEADLMHVLGAYNAINLDGGGSTALVVQGANGSPDVLNRPSGGAERYDGNNLGVYALPLAPVPLPPALALFGSGLLGVFGFGRRRVAA
jgi:exopolysaccharide biosynthesis protein